MNLIASSIEEKIQKAIANGELKNLPGEGKPIELDDDSSTPPEHRMAHRVLKNAGFVPPEVEMQNEVAQLELRLRTEKFTIDEEIKLRKQLSLKQAGVAVALERLNRVSK